LPLVEQSTQPQEEFQSDLRAVLSSLREEIRKALEGELGEIAELVTRKNADYGDSALNPLRVFSSASHEEQIYVRLDDKLSRIARGHSAGEDVVADMIGYLLLLRVARRRDAK
jgi:hypothetical protein